MTVTLPTGENVAPKAEGANCNVCPLRQMGRFVPSAGPETAEVAFVGEAPGKLEARLGIPFSGPSGNLLNLVLKHHDIPRKEVFLTNACLCRPPDNSTPPRSAIEACKPRLELELQRHGIRTVVAMGNSAAMALLGLSGVTKLRVGPGRPSPTLEDVRVIPTVHPAACLRQSDMFPSLVTDVGKVKGEFRAWREPKYFVVDDRTSAIDVIDKLRERTTDLVVDIEVDVEKDIAFDHPNRYHLLCVGLAYGDGQAVVFGESVCQDRDILTLLGDLLRSKRVIAHNGKFDLAGLYAYCGAIPLYFDTMLASYCLDERPRIHGLKHNAVEYLGAPQYDADISKYVSRTEGYGAIPRPLLYKYNAYDVACTWWLYKFFEPKLEHSGRWPYTDIPVKRLRDVHDHLCAAAGELMFVELNGIAIDREYLDHLTVKYLDGLEDIEREINFHLDAATRGKKKEINPRSPIQVKAALQEMGLSATTTNQEALEGFRERCRPESPTFAFIDTLLRHRREQKLYGTYVKGMRKRLYRGRVYPTFLLHGTTTGRLACRNPNLQNVPRESSIRRLFVPAKPENVFVQADYSQAELRVLTWLARDEYFRNIFNDPDRDIFDELTPILYGNVDHLSPAQKKELRIRVKAYVYGLAYGRTAYSIAAEFKTSVAEAERGLQAFFSVIPDIVDFRNDVIATVMGGMDLVTPFGRHRRFHLVTEENRKSVENEALAFLPQSTASDICLSAATQCRRDFSGKGVYIRNLVHDSILAECHEDKAEEVAQHLNMRMIESARAIVGDYVAFKTDYKIGRDWGSV